MFARTVSFELRRVIKAKSLYVALTASFLLALGSALVSFCNSSSIADMIFENKTDAAKWFGVSATGAYASWIGIGAMDVSPFKFLACLLLPTLSLVPYSWSLASDLASGFANHICCVVSRRSYFWSKAIASGLAGLSVYLANRLINLIMLFCLLPAYDPHPEDVMYIGVYASDPYAWLLYNCPILYMVLSLFLEGAMIFFWSSSVCLCGYYLRKRSSLLLGAAMASVLLEYVNDVIFRSIGKLGFKFGLIGILDHVGDFCLRNEAVVDAVILFLVILTVILECAIERDDLICGS